MPVPEISRLLAYPAQDKALGRGTNLTSKYASSSVLPHIWRFVF